MMRFRPGLRMILLVSILAPSTVALGVWQIDRAAQKRAIEGARLAGYGALPIGEDRLEEAPPFAIARVEGRYDGERQFLVDNHTRRGVPGYVVVTPFDTVGGRRLLVNRGWVGAAASRDKLPETTPPTATIRIVGVLWTAGGERVDHSPWVSGWPKRIAKFDGRRMSDAVEGVMATEFRLEEDQPGSLEPMILGEEMSAARHMGYAVQWFALTFTLLAAFVVLGVRRGRGE